MSKPLDTERSIEVSKQLNSKANNCFDNTYKAALLIEGSIYVQGFLVFSGAPYVPVEYSWIELDESIVDPTLPHLNKNPQGNACGSSGDFLEQAQNLYYFPAQRLTVQQLKAAVEEAQEDYPEDEPLPIYGVPPYEYYGELMLGGKDYEAAYKEAKAKCAELNKPKIHEKN